MKYDDDGFAQAVGQPVMGGGALTTQEVYPGVTKRPNRPSHLLRLTMSAQRPSSAGLLERPMENSKCISIATPHVYSDRAASDANSKVYRRSLL